MFSLATTGFPSSTPWRRAMAETAVPAATPKLHHVNRAFGAEYVILPARNPRRNPRRAGFRRGFGILARVMHRASRSGSGDHGGQSRAFRQLHDVNRDRVNHARTRQHEENNIMSMGCGACPQFVPNHNMEVIGPMAVRST